ncbi:MAG: Transcriptional regulator, LytR family [Clostridium butyricum DORA_1]|nr:MAG: Transcriptional regulator, LytR family [Clostridium butyricum DORA_1]
MIHIKLYFEYTLYVNYIKDVIIMSKKNIPNVKKISIIISILSIFFLIFTLSAFGNYINKFNTVNINKEKVIPKYMNSQVDNSDPVQPQGRMQNKYIKNIALLGIDSGDDNVGRSDCILIATIDTEHNKIKLSSIIRDSYVTIPSKNKKDKINHAYAFGGPELTLETLNLNFNLNISQFISVNFASFPKIIDKIGGITIDIKEDELKYINNYINDLNAHNNTSSSDITQTGPQIVDGTQALAYARIRYTDGGDFERSHRQRIVVDEVFKKLKELPILKYPDALDSLLPLVDTNLSSSEILSLCLDLTSFDNFNIIEERFPKDEDAEGKSINGIYYYVFDEDATITKIHDFIYD